MNLRWPAILLVVMGATLVSFLLLGDEVEASARHLFDLASSRPWMTALVVVGLLASDILLPVPSSLISAAAGATLVLAYGTVAVWTGLMIGCVFGYWLGRLIPVRASPPAPSARNGTAQIAGPLALAAARAIPIVAETSVIAAGASRMSFGIVVLTTAMANLLVALAFVGAGALAAWLDPLLAAIGATALLTAVWGLGLLARRRQSASP
jgi:uncharacterized membrane protein YdjX (TVP38/TMEM64 family)